jgi:hypothetical protein
MRWRLAACGAVASILALTAACGSDQDPAGTPTPSGEPTVTASSPVLPGEPIDIGPSEGDVVAVVGVGHDDVLHVRAAPGPEQDSLAALDPLADDLVAEGQSRLLEDSIWYLVSVDEVEGWVNSSYVQYLGGVDDATSLVVDRTGSIPRAATMPQLGLIVAEQFASTEPPSRVTMTVPASLGSLGEVTYDVVGLGDDSIGGFRLHVFGTPDGNGFVLKSVERTVLCLRGVSDGLCV